MKKGEMVGRYEIIKEVGKGAYGAVYLANDTESNQKVALKWLLSCWDLEPEVQNRFVRELSLMQRLTHENIVQLYEVGLEEGKIYCAMELVKCGTLKDVLLARGKLPVRETIEVGIQVARALSHASAQGCVHRDLKPANLFLSDDGKIKLGDFGLARDQENTRLTVQGKTVGTWRYMAPEQITAADQIDGRLDIYALGCMIFEMLAGRVPFDGQNFSAIFDGHLLNKPERLDRVVPGCPKELADLVDEMLAKAPEDRPADGDLVADRLESILANLAQEVERKDSSGGVIRTSDVAETDDGESERGEKVAPNLTERLRQGGVAEEREIDWKVLGIGAATVAIVVAVFAIVMNFL